MGLVEMMLLPAVYALLLLSSVPDTVGAPPAQPATPEVWYAGNACMECHRKSGGRLAEIVDQEWAKSVHYEENTPCESCHGGDAKVKREEFSSDDEFKEVSHLAFNPEFLFLRDRVGIGMAVEADISFACRECHSGDIEKHLGDPHEGPEAPGCLFSRDGGVNMTRGRGIAYVCAICHAKSAEKHLASAHGRVGVPSCLFCHGEGSHAIPLATTDILDARSREELGKCSPCHTTGNMTVVAKIRETFEQTAELIEQCSVQFQDLQRMGYRNLALTEMYEHLDDTWLRLREVQHGCNIREINELAKSIEHVAKHTAYDHELVQALHDARQRQTRIAVGTAGLLFVLAAMLVLYKKTFCDNPDRSTASPDAPTP